MFPNVRLMIVAVLASIMGISCALGLFAEFRVSHDSFLRESNAGAPLQLGANSVAPVAVVNAAVPFEFRFQSQPPAPAIDAVRPETLDRAAAVETPQLAPLPAPEPEPAATPAAAVSAPAIAPEVTSAAGPATVPASSQSATEAPSPAATGSIAGQNSQQETSQDRRQNAKPGAGGDLAARTPAASSSVQEAVPESQTAPESATSTLRRRPVIERRVQRTRSAVPTQNVSALQPAFQWTPQSGLQSPQPARRRVIIRRLRPARKPVAETTTPQTAVSSTSLVNPPEWSYARKLVTA